MFTLTRLGSSLLLCAYAFGADSVVQGTWKLRSVKVVEGPAPSIAENTVATAQVDRSGRYVTFIPAHFVATYRAKSRLKAPTSSPQRCTA
jgi:hypothetical protein